jgi:hypothetical protein
MGGPSGQERDLRFTVGFSIHGRLHKVYLPEEKAAAPIGSPDR